MSDLKLPRTAVSFLGILAACLNALFRVAVIPVLLTPLFDRVLLQQKMQELLPILALGFLLIVLGSVMLFIQDASFAYVAAKTSKTWREGLYLRLLALRPGTLPGTSGGLSSRILSDLKDVETYLHYGLGSLVAESLSLVGIIAVLFYYNPGATLVLLLSSIPLFSLVFFLGKRLERVSSTSQAATEQVGSVLQEGFSRHVLVRAFFSDSFMRARFAKINQHTQAIMVRRGYLAALQVPLAQILLFLALAAIVLLLVRSLNQDQMTVGEVASYVTLMALVATPAQLLPRAYAFLQQASAAAKRLRELLSPLPEDSPSEQKSAEGSALLELKALSFAYSEGTSVLSNLNLQSESRGLITIAGESGAGKTTLLHVLLHFLDPSQGEIRLKGRALSLWSEKALRQVLGYVPQEPMLLKASIRDNLCLGRSYSDSALWHVLERVGLKIQVEALADGLEHSLAEEGRGLSAGQRQRLAIARALLGKPEVLLLDEPTANLDPASEASLVVLLKEQAQERLLIAVSHRSALSQVADRAFTLTAKGDLLETVGV